ncbi:MAG: SseB family protein, partial [Microbacterium sp.]
TEEEQPPRLPLAAALPPAQTHTVEGLIDNVLLREALAEIEEGASNEQLLGVMRQSLQGHLYLRVQGDAGQQISEGQQLSVSVLRDGDQSFMLGYSSGMALRAAVEAEGDADPGASSAVAQSVASVYQQVVASGFTGIILDAASGPHRVVFPSELLEQALEQGDPEMTIKGIVSSERRPDTAARLGEALATTRAWVAVNDGSNGQPVGIAEAHTPDGKRFLQLFSHPLEVVALGRKDRPMPFTPEQLAKVLSSHTEIAGVLVDAAGPSMAVERDALGPVLVLAVDLGD